MYLVGIRKSPSRQSERFTVFRRIVPGTIMKNPLGRKSEPAQPASGRSVFVYRDSARLIRASPVEKRCDLRPKGRNCSIHGWQFLMRELRSLSWNIKIAASGAEIRDTVRPVRIVGTKAVRRGSRVNSQKSILVTNVTGISNVACRRERSAPNGNHARFPRDAGFHGALPIDFSAIIQNYHSPGGFKRKY